MRQVLVTGGAGFIGSHIVDRLCERGDGVLVVDNLSTGLTHNIADHLDRACCRFIEMDVSDPTLQALVAEWRPNAVVHLAAQSTVVNSVTDPYTDSLSNVVGSVNVALATIRTGVPRLVCAASGGTIYGDYSSPARPDATSYASNPSSPYGLSKRVMVEYLKLFDQIFQLNWTALAIGNAFGPRQRAETGAGVITIFAEALLKGEPVPVFGDGSNTRDYVYVNDVADAFVYAIDHGKGLYNVGSGVSRTVLEVASAVAKAMGVDKPPIAWRDPRIGEVAQVELDSSSFQELGWRPKTDFQEGVSQTVSFLTSRSLLKE
jgi:UDP-glucose 4-epimerase